MGMRHCRKKTDRSWRTSKGQGHLAEKAGWGLQGESICWLITNLNYLELNCL